MKILVVDDEELLVKAIKFNLEHEGYDVDVCYDGETAVSLARGGGYNLTRAAGGSGLGLSIVHDAVRPLGGTITVEENHPRGTRFIVALPREKYEETKL